MKSIFPKPQMPHEQKRLLFCLEKEIIENDLEFSKQNDDNYEAKYTWFQCWKEIINKEIRRMAKDEFLSIDDLDKTVLYNTISEQKNANKWEKEIFNQCEIFNPYKIQDLIETGIIRKSKFPQNPKRSVRFSGKRTKRSVQKRKARNTQKAETKVL